VQSADLNGNVSVSPPLRINIRYDGAGAGATSSGTPPACTGRYDKATDTVTPAPCTARRFHNVDYCFEGDCCTNSDRC
jgi:hypothetical protein